VRRGALIAFAALAALLPAPAAAQAGFGILPGSLATTAFSKSGESLVLDTQASSHPYSYNLSFALNTDSEGHSEGGEMRDLLITLPPGLLGDPEAVPKCPRQDFEGFAPHCSVATQIGFVEATIGGAAALGPLYNLEPPPGYAGQLGFSAAALNALQNASLDPGAGYPITLTTNSIPTEVTAISATVWGTPADPSHDGQRGKALSGESEPISTDAPRLPFLTLPAQCTAPLVTRVEVDSKLAPGEFTGQTAYSLDSGANRAPLSGCDAVPFKPSVSSTTTSAQAESPSGLDFNLTLPNEGLLNPNPGAIAETEPVKTEVTLPAGIAVNPSAAAGQTACPLTQFEPPPGVAPSCPEASKVGTLIAHSPLLDEPIEGGVYLAEQQHNPFGSLIALYFLARAPQRGVLVKQAGQVQIDPTTGQLTTTFDHLPPLPYSDFQVRLREGSRGALTTPQVCGTYQTTASLYPFSDPGTATVRTAPFQITSGANGGACASSEAALPNSPSFEAGTQTPLAGEYSPLIFKVSRDNGSQKISSIDATLPPGLTSKLAGLTTCSDAQISQAAARSNPGEGATERDHPSCPSSSQFGTATVGAGSGSPLYVTGNAYLAGPYKGAPLSLAFITPAIAGPFDLGTVVVRTAAYIDPTTAQISVKSDPIPTILHGIPLDVRSIAVNASRSQFTLNPTNCSAMTFGGTAISTLGDAASLSNRFQVGGCKGLDYEPQLHTRLYGGTKRGAFPKLRAIVEASEGEANSSRLAVTLPHSEFLEQGHFGTICTRVQFAARACPAKSVYGWVRVYTPLLDYALEGPVYLRSSSHNLPDLVLSLHGPPSQPIALTLDGRIDSKNKGIRTSFEGLPDAPFSRAILTMQGGRKGLLVNSKNICQGTNRSLAKMTGQNGKAFESKPVLKNSKCTKHKKKSGHGKKKNGPKHKGKGGKKR
jgi:hypothetical protein